jgi:outer membrane protein assembly factor BamB
MLQMNFAEITFISLQRLSSKGGPIMKSVALNLILMCILLLPSCDAQENNSENNSTAGLFLWPAADEMPSAQQIEDAYYSVGTEILSAKTSSLPLSLAYPVADLSGDSIADFLLLSLATDQANDSFASRISAMNGSDGGMIWQKDYQDGLAFASAIGDMNGDGCNDVMVNVLLRGLRFIPYSEVAVLSGRNGTEIWSKPQLLALSYAQPLKDLTGDEKTDLRVHVFGIDSLNNTLATKIIVLDGVDGKEICSEIFSGGLAIEYGAGNLTGDRDQDDLLVVYRIDESMEDISTEMTARNGQDRSQLWNATFRGCLALAFAGQDLTGDGIDDLLIYIVSLSPDSAALDLGVMRGDNGTMLWRKSYGSSLILASAGPDLTGDGARDLMIYEMGETGDGMELQAVKGDDGKLLWSRPSTILMPQQPSQEI